MRTLATVLVLLSACLTAAQELSESVEVQILEIEAVVLDRAGATVEDLTREQFVVTLNGKPVEVTNFYRVRRGEIVEERGNAKTAPSLRAPASLIIVIDDLHLRPGPRKRALDALHNYIDRSLTEGTTVTLVRWNGTMSTRVKPTTDRLSVLRGIREMQRHASTAMLRMESARRQVMSTIDEVILEKPGPGGRGRDKVSAAMTALQDAVTFADEQRRQTEDTIAALGELMTVSSGLDGRKMLLYVSETLPQQPGAEVLNYAARVFTDFEIEGLDLNMVFGGPAGGAAAYDQSVAFRRLSSLAQAAGIVFSALDPGGLSRIEGTSAEYAMGGLATLDSFLIRENAASGQRFIAGETGGRFINNENDLERAIAILTDHVSTWYSLGVRALAGRVAEVRVSIRGRDDLRVLTPRRRTLHSAEEALAATLHARLYSREASNPLEARLDVGLVWPRGGKCVVPVEVSVPRRKLTLTRPNEPAAGELAIHAVAMDDREKVSTVYTTKHPVLATEGEQVTRSLLFGFQPQRYVLSLAIADVISGEMSYLQFEVDATICGR